MPIKIKGDRSVETKLERLACELREDARRILADEPAYADIADALQVIGSKLGAAARKIRNRPA
jgi:hypothetical protein